MPERKVAFITGASRGIGRGCALELARRAFDVVLTARTVTGQERLEHSSTVRKSLTDPLPGSLEQTAREVRALGVDALVAKLDLSRREDWPAAIDAALGRFARIDVLVNNGRYVGPGHMDPFEETPIELIEQMMLCNVIAPLHLIKLCLPAMKRQGGGIVINITSSAGERETAAPIGKGGWGLGYSLTKAAFNRMVPGLAKELRPYHVAVIGLMPGFVGSSPRPPQRVSHPHSNAMHVATLDNYLDGSFLLTALLANGNVLREGLQRQRPEPSPRCCFRPRED